MRDLNRYEIIFELEKECYEQLLYIKVRLEGLTALQRSGNQGVMIRSSNLNNFIVYQPNLHPGRIGRGASSRFKGVLKLNSNNWGARISLMYKPYWLGTYQTEEEAALAYDTAAIKLQRGDSSLNFPLACHSVQESAFQSQYTNEQILEMIRDKTYSSSFAEFMAGKAMMMEAGLRNSLNQTRVLYKMIFHKQLMLSDFAENKNFLIPKEYALEYLPQLSPTGSRGDAIESKFIDLIFYDKHCRSWTFRYAYWNSTDSFMFTRGWRHFIKMNSLNPGDTVILYKGGYDVNFERNVFYFIDFNRNGWGIQAGSNMRQEVSQIENVDNGVDVDPKGKEEINNGVVLFGVQIG